MPFDLRVAYAVVAVLGATMLAACSQPASPQPTSIKPALNFQHTDGFTVTSAGGKTTITQDVNTFAPQSGNLPPGIPIDTATESNVAGKTIEVTIVAHAAAATDLIATYYTVGYGNSGQTSLHLTPSASTVSFKYSVPKQAQLGAGDYLALYPSQKAVPIEIESVTINVQP